MKDFFSILRRFVPPYKYYLALNIFFNILASVLTLFSFALIIPILEILFKLKQASYTFMEWGSGSIKDVAINNFYYYITTIIDEKGAGFALLILGVFLMVMTFFKTAATYLSSYFMIPLRSGIVRDIRNYVYEKVVSLPIGFFTSEKKGDVMARMSGDVGEIENSIMASLDMMFKNPIMIIVCLATMFAISWQLTLFVLILLPTAGYIMGQVGKKLKRRSLEGQNQWGLLMSIIEETLGGLRIVKAFNAEDKMIKWFHDDNNRFYRISNRINRRQSLAHPMSEFLGTCTICIVLWYGGSLILSGTSSIDAASFIYYLVIFYSIINPAKDLSKAALDMMFKNPIMIIVCLATMFAISWQLTLFVLILLPTAGYIMGQVGKKLKRRSLEGQNQWGLLMSIIEETLGGLRIVKAFNAEDKMIKWFHDDNNRFYRISNRINRRQSLAHPMSEFLGTCTICIVLWYGGSLILSGTSSIDAASFIYYLVIFYSIINPAKDLSKAAYSIQKGLASMVRVDLILSAVNPIQDPKNPVELKEMKEGIEYRGVSFRYSTENVVKHVDLSIKKGQTVALVGQSGSGKSTMADLLPRFYDVNEGGIYIDGINIKDFRVHDLRGLMGNVNQEAILFNDSFYNNITFGVENATMEQVIEAAKIANAHDFIMATEQGYDTCIGDRGSRLSGGQRQRVSIARAILKNPPILILDEATSALDTESERLVQEALENLMRNRTTLVIAHRLSTIKDADLICVMHEGEIVERGRHDELIKLDRYYKRLVDMQKF